MSLYDLKTEEITELIHSIPFETLMQILASRALTGDDMVRACNSVWDLIKLMSDYLSDERRNAMLTRIALDAQANTTRVLN